MLGLAKELLTERIRDDGGYELVYQLHLVNYGDQPLLDLSLVDALRLAFPEPAEFAVEEISSNELSVNPDYSGEQVVQMLTSGNDLAVGGSAVVRLRLFVVPNSQVRTFSNSAVAYATLQDGTRVTDTSTAGPNPDPDGDRNPGNNSQTTDFTILDVDLSVTFSSSVSITQTAGIAIQNMTLGLVGVLGDWTAQLSASFSNSSADTLGINASGPLGEVRLNSSASFEFLPPRFVSWQGGAAFTLLGVDLTAIAKLTTPQTASNAVLSWSTSAGDDLSFSGSAKLGLCPAEFQSTNICMTTGWPGCETDITGCVAFTGLDGFTSAALTASDILLFENLLGMEWLLDVAISYAPDEKTLVPTLKMQPDWPICVNVQLLGEAVPAGDPTSFGSLSIYGLQGECAMDNGVSLTFAESLDAAKNGSVTGKADYFERLGVAGPLSSCCGSPGSFSFDVFFQDPGTAPSGTLFTMALLTASVNLQLTEKFAFSFSGAYPLDTTEWQLGLTFSVLW